MDPDIWELKKNNPILDRISRGQETVWINPNERPAKDAIDQCVLTLGDILDASARWDRFADYFRTVFPETAPMDGILESPLRGIPAMQECLERDNAVCIPGEMWIKLDSSLPVSGSIKARGGIYEVLKTAEEIAEKHGLLKEGEPYRCFDSPAFRQLFSRYSIAVGSTGNLGLSIGIMSARLGFRATVHMSADARQWKKDMLRGKGVTVVEYDSDYSTAVREGRKKAQGDPFCHFVDDENSKTLFLGYSVAALRLQRQLEERHIAVDEEHPLFVYLPCGVGGGPGGIAFGLKQVFGDAVHCFFAEPTRSCCMTIGMATGLNDALSVQDLGLDNHTAADGLAVGRASSFVGTLMKPFLSGCYTLTDDRMFRCLAQLADSEGIFLEPSALAGMFGPVLLASDPDMRAWLQGKNLQKAAGQGTHLVWATGGSMVPGEEMQKYCDRGREILERCCGGAHGRD